MLLTLNINRFTISNCLINCSIFTSNFLTKTVIINSSTRSIDIISNKFSNINTIKEIFFKSFLYNRIFITFIIFRFLKKITFIFNKFILNCSFRSINITFIIYPTTATIIRLQSIIETISNSNVIIDSTSTILFKFLSFKSKFTIFFPFFTNTIKCTFTINRKSYKQTICISRKNFKFIEFKCFYQIT